MTGVRRAFRGRGIAGALKRAEIAWAKQAGYERLQTNNEVRNEPIRRLNERHGYVAASPGSSSCTTLRCAGTGSVDRRQASACRRATAAP